MSTENLYASALDVMWAIYLMMALLLMFINIPCRAVFGPFSLARKFMVAMFLNILVQSTILWLFKDFFFSKERTEALSVFFFYLSFVFFSHAFITLIDHGYSSRKQLMHDLSWALLVGAICLASLFMRGEVVQLLFIFVATALLFLLLVNIIRRFKARYKPVRQELDRYYSEPMYFFVRWVSRVIFVFLAYGLLSVIFLFVPFSMKLGYLLLGVIINIYIVFSFINYLHAYEKIVRWFHARKEQLAVLDNLSVERQRNESKNKDYSKLSNVQIGLMNIWIANERYCEPGITIDQMAHELNTNRNYLSRYINDTYHTNFSHWISQLRIEKAKALFLKHPEESIEQIGFMAGFSSGSYFNRVFSRIEGESPLQWKNKNTKTD